MDEEILRRQRDAESASSKRKWQRAIDLYTGLIAEPESSAPPESRFTYYLNRGFALRALGQSKQALEDYSVAIGLNPTNWKPHLNAGLIYAQDLQDFAAAVRAFDLALALNPTDTDSLAARGTAKGSAGDVEGSKHDFEAAISLRPDHLEALYNLGNLYLENGDPAAAARLYEQAQRVAPFDLDVRKNHAIAKARLRSGITNPRAVGVPVQSAMRSNPGPAGVRRGGGCLKFVLVVIALYLVWRFVFR